MSDFTKGLAVGSTLGVDTSDATAAASDILSGKTAYIDGEKVTGSLVQAIDHFPTTSVSTVVA